MPAFTVSAVNTGTEALTAAGHGLTTGDRFRLRNVGGALPAATPALAAVTDYFAIRVDANNIKVAISSSNASAGTAVDLTGSGSGTTTIEYGLPYCVPRISAPLTQQFSADNNATWNSLVALWARLTGQTQTTWPNDFAHGDRTEVVLGTDFKSSTGTNVTSDDSGAIATTALTVLLCRLPLRAGDQIKSVLPTLTGNGTVDTSFDVRKITVIGGQSSIGSTSFNNVGTVITTLDVTDTLLGVGESILVVLNVNAAGLSILNCRYTYDHPAP